MILRYAVIEMILPYPGLAAKSLHIVPARREWLFEAA